MVVCTGVVRYRFQVYVVVFQKETFLDFLVLHLSS